MSAAWQPEMDHLRRRVEELEKMLCQGHPAGVVCGVCRPEPVPECCTDGTCPTCAPMMAWADYRKDYQPRDTVTASKAFFAGWEAYPDHHRAGWAFSGTPKPGNKEWIDAAKRWRDAFHDLNSAPEPDPEPQSYVESLESRIKVALALCEAWDDNAADAIEAALRGESCIAVHDATAILRGES